MSANPPEDPAKLRPNFWAEIPLAEMTKEEWEALCDGCGKCCLNKLQYRGVKKVAYTRIACKLFDGATSRCKHYENRHDHVPECVQFTYETMQEHVWWMPRSCAYRLLYEGKPLADWHPLLSGDPDSVARAGMSMRGRTLSEADIPEDDWENYIMKGKL